MGMSQRNESLRTDLIARAGQQSVIVRASPLTSPACTGGLCAFTNGLLLRMPAIKHLDKTTTKNKTKKNILLCLD
jgi:hypothetical protein